MPLRHAGRFDEASRSLRDVLSAAESRRIATEAIEASWALAKISLVHSDAATAREWHAVAGRWCEAVDEELLLTAHSAYGLEIAICEGARGRATLAKNVLALPMFIRNEARPRAHLLALRLATDLALGLRVALDAEQELHSLLARSLTMGDHDLAACAVARSMHDRGNEDGRRMFLVDYQNARRERYPLPAYLRTAFVPDW